MFLASFGAKMPPVTPSFRAAILSLNADRRRAAVSNSTYSSG